MYQFPQTGDEQQVLLPSSFGQTHLDGKGGASFSFWIKQDGIDAWSRIVDIRNQSDHLAFTLERHESLGLIAKCRPTASETHYEYASSNELDDTNWHHIVFVIDVAGDSWTMWYDGGEEAFDADPSWTATSWDITGNPTVSPGNSFFGDASQEYGSFKGHGADFRFYTRALSLAEAQTIYACRGRDTIFDGLVVRYKMMEKHPDQYVTTIIDMMGNVNGTGDDGGPQVKEDIYHYRRAL